MSFLIDPPLLVASGAAIESTVADERARGRAALGTVALFVGVSTLLYVNAPGLGRIWRHFGAASGREFMLTSGLAPVDEDGIGVGRHLLALAQFALYPVWLELGRRLVRGR